MKMERIKFDCHGAHAPAYTCDQPGDCSGVYYQATDVDEIFELLMALPEAKKQLDFLKRGIGVKRPASVWLDVANAIEQKQSMC